MKTSFAFITVVVTGNESAMAVISSGVDLDLNESNNLPTSLRIVTGSLRDMPSATRQIRSSSDATSSRATLVFSMLTDNLALRSSIVRCKPERSALIGADLCSRTLSGWTTVALTCSIVTEPFSTKVVTASIALPLFDIMGKPLSTSTAFKRPKDINCNRVLISIVFILISLSKII